MPSIKATCFPSTDAAVQAVCEFEMLHLGSGSPADRERNRFGERKVPERPAHRPKTPIPKLAQADGVSN